MKIALISDLHIKIYKQSERFLPHIISSLEFFIEESKKRNVDAVFVLGDVFHYKNTVSVYAQHEALKIFRKIFDMWPTYMIPGNHDILSKGDAKINGLSIFEDSCNVFNEYGLLNTKNVAYHFLPYFNDQIILDKVKEIKLEKGKRNILCSHLGLKGFMLENGHEDVYSDLSQEDIDVGFNRIFTGHYHSHQTIKKTTYISSPYESHYGDKGDHGFCFYNDETDELEFLENHLSPRFIITELTSKNFDYINTLENSFIKLIVKKNVNNSLLVKFREKLLKKNFDVVFDFNISATSAKIAVAADWEKFVNESPEEILMSYISDNPHPSFTKEDLFSYIGL